LHHPVETYYNLVVRWTTTELPKFQLGKLSATLDEGLVSNFLRTNLDSFEANCILFGLGPSFKGLGTNLKLSTNKIAWIHWFLDLGPSSKVTLRPTLDKGPRSRV
jgi:hypothetical protein